jgi:5-oxoprolinase (ATP-hydrolysing)
MSGNELAIGIDIGGTFTDVVVYDARDYNWRTAKVPTAPLDPVGSVIRGLEQLVPASDVALVGLICHATTLGVNAIIERRGAATGLIVTEGFEDLIQMGTGQRYDIYELFPMYPEPMVAGTSRYPIRQRTGPGGESLTTLDINEVERATKSLVAGGVQAVAVCFLHSYAYPDDERSAADVIRRVAPSMRVSLSSEVVPELREYPRLMTTVANAYIQPIVSAYLERLGVELASRGYICGLLTMLSGGGMSSVSTASDFPVRLLESGPAAGAIMAEHFSISSGHADLLVFDMGGTTAKASIVRSGQALRTGQFEVARVHRFKPGSGIPIKAPALDLLEIGAGGGSIARPDRLGLLAVGPDSAAADPGPCCYGRGGVEPTVTDADLVLGYLDPEYFLGGRMPLDLPAARTAMSQLGTHFAMDETQAAWFVHSTVNDNMAGAARVHLAERGVDPSQLTMFALGGAAPVHAEAVARAVGVTKVLIPPAPGVGSAAGLLLAPLAFDLSRSVPRRLDDLRWEELAEIYDDLERRAIDFVVGAGAEPDAVTITRSVDMQVEGQVHEIEVPFPGRIDDGTRERIAAAFDESYRSRFRHPPLARPLRVVTWRVRATAGIAPEVGPRDTPLESTRDHAPRDRAVYFEEANAFVSTRVLHRSVLRGGQIESGPLVIEEEASTTIVSPSAQLTVLDDLSLLLELHEVKSGRSGADDG